MFEIRLLGQFEIYANGAAVALPSRPAQSLLARLALTPGMAHRREKLAGELWPDAHEANARSNLRHALWRIRRALACDKAQSARDIVRTNNIGVSMIARPDTLVDAIRLTQAAQNIHLPTDALAEAAGLYQGELLPGFYDDWVGWERIRLQAAFDALLLRLTTRLSAEGRWREVVRWGMHWFAHGDAQEAACCALMNAHHALGNLDYVRSTYRQCTAHLTRQLGVTPSANTRMLFDKLVATARVEAQPAHAHDDFHYDPRLMREQTMSLLAERHWQMRAFMRFDTLLGPSW
jgi:DNA-binding SARP family transcriptional activator